MKPNDTLQPELPLPGKKQPVAADILLNLLDDQDEMLSFLASEQLLARPELSQIISSNQDSPDAVRRKKIHQLAAVAGRRELQREMLEQVKAQKYSLWQALSAIDLLYDTQSSQAFINEKIQNFQYLYRRETGGRLEELGTFCDNNGFVPAKEYLDDIGFYLLGDVLDRRLGAGGLLCAIAKRIAEPRLQLDFCLRAGHVCLTDKNNNVLDPTENWKFFAKLPPQALRRCSDNEILGILLCQMLTVSVILWYQRDIYLFSTLLAGIYDLPLEIFPYPLGRKQENKTCPTPHPKPRTKAQDKP